MTIKNYDSPDLVEGQTWTTEELTEQFDVIAFAAPFCKVKRRSDGVEGYLQFKHSPRVYFDFRPV
jgi:hypothetical protein